MSNVKHLSKLTNEMDSAGAKKGWLGLNHEEYLWKEELKKLPRKAEKRVKTVESPIILYPKKENFDIFQKLAPNKREDLAVQPKKVAQVEAWLKDNVSDNKKNTKTAKFLLITGPTGSGKTATVQTLCKEMKIDISEWLNPVDQDFDIAKGPNQLTKFTEFLSESRWKSLVATNDKKITVVEEFPNYLMRNPEEFSTVLEECYYRGNYAIVFICTDSGGKTSLVEKLFTQELKTKYLICEISFNACAATVLKIALKRALVLVQSRPDLFKTPSENMFDTILFSAMGDIKSAINQFYFACLLGTKDLPQDHVKNRKRRRKAVATVKSMLKDQKLGLFHGIGKIMNPKRLISENSWRLECDLDKLVDEFSTFPTSFLGFLFENYLKYFGDIEDVSKSGEVLSFSSLFLKYFERDDILAHSLWISSLGLMIFNEHQVSKWTQITAPKKYYKKDGSKSGKNLSIMDLCYVNTIKSIPSAQFIVNY